MTDNSTLETLKASRDRIISNIEALEAELEVVENAISDLTDVNSGKIPKDRIVELLKTYLTHDTGKPFKEIREFVRGHGGISHRNLDKRLKTSLTRSVNEGTFRRDGELYFLV